jgi:hypothetical protein
VRLLLLGRWDRLAPHAFGAWDSTRGSPRGEHLLGTGRYARPTRPARGRLELCGLAAHVRHELTIPASQRSPETGATHHGRGRLVHRVHDAPRMRDPATPARFRFGSEAQCSRAVIAVDVDGSSTVRGRRLEMPSRLCVAVAAVLALLALSAGASTLASDETEVLITGPANWDVPTGYLLKIGDLGWIVIPGSPRGPGVGGFPTSGTLPVTVQRLSDCAVIVRFRAAPGSHHVIRFDGNGQATIETTSGLDAGPSLGPGRQIDCLPGTSTAPGSQPAGNALPASVLVILVALGAGAWLLRARVRQRQASAA